MGPELHHLGSWGKQEGMAAPALALCPPVSCLLMLQGPGTVQLVLRVPGRSEHMQTSFLHGRGGCLPGLRPVAPGLCGPHVLGLSAPCVPEGLPEQGLDL